MPKKLSREERLAKRRKWMNSSRSLNGRLAPFRQAVDDAEKQILLECQDWGFGVKRAARCLHTTPLRIRRLLRKHGIRLPTQPTQEQVNAQCERLKAQAKNPAPTEDSLSRLARLMEEEQARKSVASAVNEAPAKPNGTQLARPVRRLESVEPSASGLQKFYRQVLIDAKYPGCGHSVTMDNVAWLAPEIFVCARCARSSVE